MAAIYGIVGDASRSEVAAIGARLSHRGTLGAQWSPGPGVWFGMQNDSVEGLTADGPLLFDGSVDNRWQLSLECGQTAIKDLTPQRDTALLQELLGARGAEGLELIAGPMALTWWDGRRRVLVLARDRIGYGPLHFCIDAAGRFVFASEYKALLALETVAARPNRDAIQVIQSTKWSKPGETCLDGIYPVAPGTVLELDAGRLAMRRYFHLPLDVQHGDEERHAKALREVFLHSLYLQTQPHTRIGVSLSGGLDSAVVAAGTRHVASTKPLHTFTAGYGPDDPEIVNAARIAATLGTRHHEVVLAPADLPDLLPKMVWHLEEPIGREDIAYLFVTAREASRHVDLLIAGFGFDGLFAGLPRHRLVHLANKVPLARGALEQFYDFTVRSVEPHTPVGRGLRYAYFRGSDYPAPQVSGAKALTPFQGFPRNAAQPLSAFLHRSLLLNPYQVAIEHFYSAMGLRINAQHTNPMFLSVAFAIPDKLKIRGGTQKYILRKACADLLSPDALAVGKSFNRLKHDLVLSDVLDAMADQYLTRADVAARGLFDPAYVSRLRSRAPREAYGRERVYRLWSLLLTELWGRIYLDHRGEQPHAAPARQSAAAAPATITTRTTRLTGTAHGLEHST
jgi:asparagine synthase (glutamine-hydrolysing)